MNTTLTVDDPLAGQVVTIVITLAAGEQPRDERPALVSLGVPGQRPVIKSGLFGRMPTLIHAAWTAFAVQAQTAEEAAETVAKEQVVAVARTDEDGPAPVPAPRPAAPKPQAKNLSLF